MKFNSPSVGSGKTTNAEGGEAFVLSAINKLVQTSSNCFYKEPMAYSGAEEAMKEAVEAVAKSEPEFVLKLAAYLRNEGNLRTVSQYLLVKASTMPETKQYVRQYAPSIIKRADELTEALACYLKEFCKEENGKHAHKKIPNSLKKGIADAFPNFSEYELAKYNRDSKVKFKDVIMLCHPSSPQELIKKVLDEKLAVPDTWETIISKEGSTKASWEKVIDMWTANGQVRNYMALIRNINNCLKVGVSDEHWKKLLWAISNVHAVRYSKLLPYRFYTAYKTVKIEDAFKAKELKDALSVALVHSVANLPHLKGRTLIACDNSGSMEAPVSEKSDITRKEIADIMGAMANKFCDNAITSSFGEEFQVVPMSGDILLDMEKIRDTRVGCSTNGYKAVEYLLKNNIKVDRIMVFTDEQMWDSDDRLSQLSSLNLSPKGWARLRGYEGYSMNKLFQQYKQIAPDVKLYIINLAGYGNSCVDYNDKNVVSLAGFSERTLEFVALYELGLRSLVQKIRDYNPI